MEDAHIALAPISKGSNNSLFAVFDGHGGKFFYYSRRLSLQVRRKTLRKIVIVQPQLQKE